MIQLLIVDGYCFAAEGLREFLVSVPEFAVGEVLGNSSFRENRECSFLLERGAPHGI